MSETQLERVPVYRTMLNLRHLRAFQEVARCNSVSLASRRVYLSQPAITQAIAKLEAMLNAPLFERRRDGMTVTEPGQFFLARVERALGQLQAGAREARRGDGKRGDKGFVNFDQLLTMVQLRALVAVSDAGNFSLAARAIGISQPSLYRAARDLEQLSGMTLFNTTPQGVELTRPAQTLARHAKLAFAELEQGFAEIEEWRGLDSGRIVVGSMPLARSYILPTAINALVRDRPQVQVQVIDGRYADLLHGLRHGEIDLLIGALRDPVPIDDVVQERLFDAPLAVVARAGHPLAGRAGLSIAEIMAYPWVAPPRDTPAGSHLNQMIQSQNLPVTPVRIVSSSLVLVRELLRASDHLTIISTHQIKHELELGILVPLAVDMSRSKRPIGLTLRRDWRPTTTQRVFLDLIRAAAKSLRDA